MQFQFLVSQIHKPFDQDFHKAVLKHRKYVLLHAWWKQESNTFSTRTARELTEGLTAVQSGSEAAGVGVDGDVGGRGVQQRISDDDWVDDALTGDGVEHLRAHIWWWQRHELQGDGVIICHYCC